MAQHYVCSSCGADAYVDGRSGDGPILLCGCDRRGRQWVNEGSRGGYWTNPSDAKPIEAPYKSEADEWDEWIRGR